MSHNTPAPTLESVLDRYRRSISILKKGYTQECYRIASIKRHEVCQRPLTSITSVDIAQYRDNRLSDINPKTQKTIAASTVRLEMSLLSNVMDVAVIEWGLIDNNPVKRVRKPKPPVGRSRRVLPREDKKIRKLCHDHENPELLSIYILALSTAMRQGEILKLRWEHIDMKHQTAHVPDTKNGTSRDVPLSLEAREAITRLGVRSEGKLFTYTPSGLKSVWRVSMSRLEIADLHFHDLRHEAISRLFELGTLNVMEVAAISGHKSLGMLKRYTHLKARKLVRKLDANKRSGKHHVTKHFIPYPARVVISRDEAHDKTWERSVAVCFPDFGEDEHRIECTTPLGIEKMAQALLCQRIVTALASGDKLPEPETQQADSNDMIYIDPLGGSRTA